MHEFVLLDYSRAGVDTFVDAYISMYESLQPGEAAPTLVDGRSGSQPVRYIIERMRRLNIPASVRKSRVAVLRGDSILNNIVAAMMSYFPATPVRFFRPDEHEAAVNWLLRR